jgi:prepilin-type N-terminal cleavage/methylation domain-containing protein
MAGSAAGGFTLLEVMLAVLIFSVCMTAIYSAFRTSSRAFESGRRETEQMQTVRFVLDQVTRDLRAVFYETDYNVKFKALEQDAIRNQDHILKLLEEQREKREASREEGKQDDSVDNVGTRIDLRFRGEDGGDADRLELAHFLSSDGVSDNSFLGAERVRYYLEGTDLYRQRSRVVEIMQMNPNLETDLDKAQDEREQREKMVGGSKKNKEKERIDPNKMYGGGNVFPFFSAKSDVKFYVPVSSAPLPPELLARNVVSFDVKYGFFFGEWQEADSWDSDAKEHRTPAFNIDPSDPNFFNKLVAFEVRPADHLPTYVRLRLSIGRQDSEKAPGKEPVESALADRETKAKQAGRAHTIDTIVWLPAASETYVPTDATYFGQETPEPSRTGNKETDY